MLLPPTITLTDSLYSSVHDNHDTSLSESECRISCPLFLQLTPLSESYDLYHKIMPFVLTVMILLYAFNSLSFIDNNMKPFKVGTIE